jgi:hypothetical protein
MEKEKLESLLIDYIDNNLNAVDRHMIEHELMHNSVARKIYEELKEVIEVMEQSPRLEPSSNLKTNFDKFLKGEVSAGNKTRAFFFQPAFYRMAAAVALIILGGGVGFWISKSNEDQKRLSDIEREMEVTRKQLADTKQMMLGLLDNEQSASQRIKGVNVAMEFQSADDQIVKALFNTLDSDPNTNVRLAALEALAKFKHDPVVRRGLIAALGKQRDPMVQITLIQLMVEMKEKEVVTDLQQIVDDKGSIQAVKDEAYSGILKLS